MRPLAPIGLLAVLVAAFGSPAASTAKLPEVPESYLFTPAGKVTPLRAGVTYEASRSQPLLRVTPDAGWSGAQWKGGTDYFQGGGPPNFGWVALARGSTKGIPQGSVTIMTAYARTPSVAATVNVLRTRGRGATYGPTSQAKLGGFSGIQFDGQIVGAKNRDHNGHYFIPFSPPSHAAKYYPDEYPVYGDAFRVVVLDVRGKTVIVYIENVALPVEQFPAFLGKAEQLLKSLSFPATATGG
jgi:hypothetical protein